MLAKQRFTKFKSVFCGISLLLLIVAFGPMGHRHVMDAHALAVIESAHQMHVHEKRVVRHVPETRPALAQRLREKSTTKSQWMKLAKTVPILHAEQLKQFDVIEVTATAYTAGKESTGKTPDHPQYGITYSGVKVRRDVFSTIAADQSVFPIGTVLHIPGYGYGVVADTGRAIKGRKIDLFFQTKQQVYDEWGKKKVKVRVIRMGDGKLTEWELDRLNDLILEKEERKLSV